MVCTLPGSDLAEMEDLCEQSIPRGGGGGGGGGGISATGAVKLYQKAIKTEIIMERAMIFRPERCDMRQTTKPFFARVWGQSVDQILVVGVRVFGPCWEVVEKAPTTPWKFSLVTFLPPSNINWFWG